MKRLFIGLLAFLGTYGICHLVELAGAVPFSFSVMSILLFPVLYGMLAYTGKQLSALEKRQRRRRYGYAGAAAYLFAVSMIMGYQLQMRGMTDGGWQGKGLLLIRAICIAIAVFPLGNALFWYLETLGADKEQKAESRKEWKTGVVFMGSAVFVFVCLIPVWLAYYPIIMSYDFHRQVNEAAKGFIWFWPYQPIAHTWIIWVFLQLGYRMGSLENGMAGMALLHMLLYALTTAYAITFIYRMSRKKWAVAAAALFFGIFPLNSVMVLCTTKDVIFSILFLLFVLLLAERFFAERGKGSDAENFAETFRGRLKWDLLILLEGCLMVQFRNNAIYALAVFGILWVAAAPKKEKLEVLLLCVLLIVGGKGTAAVIKAALGTQIPGAKAEMYSVPMQQFARVGYLHGAGFDEETRQLLNQYVSQGAWGGYNPAIADGIKAASGGAFEAAGDGHMAQLFSDWLKLGLRYPNEYIDAFLELTRGYWFLDDRSYTECLGYGIEGRMGIIYTYTSSEIEGVGDIKHESKFPWLEEQLEYIVSANAFYKWPVLSVLFKAAFYGWGLLLLFIAFLFRQQKKQAILCLFPMLYLATMLLGPMVCMRYVFPIMLVLPVLAVLLWQRE